MASKVFLVGAGCGTIDFLTARAKEVLQQADVIVYDALIDPDLLLLAPQAIKIQKGKRGHQSSARQSEIHDSLYELSKSYPRVVRLQGGDPMVFGRGMEELDYLRSKGVDVEIVPGISSMAGIPALESFGLTKRGSADGFLVLTASSANAPRRAEEWKTIADFKGTVVFYMGMSKLSSISHSLIKAGKPADTPCVLLTSLSPAHTRSAKTTLDHLEQTARDEHLYSPGIVVVGGTAKDFLPLCHPLVLLTGSDSLNKKIKDELSCNVRYEQVLKTEYTDFDLPAPVLKQKLPDWIVLTSGHGVDVLFEQFRKNRIDLRTLAHTRFALIGKQSAKRLEHYGLQADLIASQANSASLLHDLQAQLKKGDRVWLAQSQQAIPVLSNGLKNTEGITVEQIPLYSISYLPDAFSWLPEAGKKDQALLDSLKADVLVLASRTAAKAARKEGLLERAFYAVCISAEVAAIVEEDARKAGVKVVIASEVDAAGIAKAIETLPPFVSDRPPYASQSDQSQSRMDRSGFLKPARHNKNVDAPV